MRAIDSLCAVGKALSKLEYLLFSDRTELWEQKRNK